MIDYAGHLLALAKGIKNIGYLLLMRRNKEAVNAINDLIINSIELKQWVLKQDETHQ